MSNYKVKVNNEAESREVQELFFVLGYEKGVCSVGSYPAMIVTAISLNTGNLCSTRSTGLNCKAHKDHKELTIPQLKDLVVLKRNSIDDATHKCETINERLGFLSSDGVEYIWSYSGSKWFKPEEMGFKKFKLKPIEKKEMKEYLVPQDNGKYVLTKATEKRVSDWVEVPEGADISTICETFMAFWKDGAVKFIGADKDWDFKYDLTVSDYLDVWGEKASIVWQRHTQPEELPLVDDEPKSLNDTYAEIEQVRHNHYFKDVSDVNQIDVYEVLKRFNVTDPCLQHIVKKALCAGQRGHKDLKNDLQDILDTAKRAVEINK